MSWALVFQFHLSSCVPSMFVVSLRRMQLGSQITSDPPTFKTQSSGATEIRQAERALAGRLEKVASSYEPTSAKPKRWNPISCLDPQRLNDRAVLWK
ncbi:predicted protein [Uncinocarpus reesii 1704]|uniref:Uncharacterized protein n=1 Tax=Uncinocarpus reesii (strain UAMH 1704) TaxID=336963 RepID=C4JEN7_UNCRE|nr:uncharacterized protein UREG_02197 [Uncinocarpus reesii 1704]EEP77348.1 predicted protein [Uncinocarpus reesii 1704]